MGTHKIWLFLFIFWTAHFAIIWCVDVLLLPVTRPSANRAVMRSAHFSCCILLLFCFQCIVTNIWNTFCLEQALFTCILTVTLSLTMWPGTQWQLFCCAKQQTFGVKFFSRGGRGWYFKIRLYHSCICARASGWCKHSVKQHCNFIPCPLLVLK